MRLAFTLAFGLISGCQSLPAQDVAQTLSDGEACVVGILATASGTPDLDGLLKCGVTIADVWNLVTKLEKAPSSGSNAAALPPATVAWHAKLEGVKAQIVARHDGGLPQTSAGVK
jgi:hypothetical protein